MAFFCGNKGCNNMIVVPMYCDECKVKIMEKSLARFPEPPKGKTWIYFIRSGEDGPVKIGRAKDPRKRLMRLQTGSSDDLVLETAMLGGPEIEKKLHKAFRRHRIHGEWFRPCVELSRLMAAARKAEAEMREKRLSMALGE